MNKIIKLIVFFIILLGITFKADAYQIGVWENSPNAFNPALGYKYPNVKMGIITRNSLSRISVKDYPILIFTRYQFVDANTINTLNRYVQSGGKLILISPLTEGDDATFKKVAKLIDINVESISDIRSATEINWVEKTVNNNALRAESRTAKILLDDNASHLAVFGDIEKHESAITASKKGVLINWCWGIDGEKKFNEKSMAFIIQSLLPKGPQQTNTPTTKPHSSIVTFPTAPKEGSSVHPESMELFHGYMEDIQKLRNDRNNIRNYQDNLINYSIDMTMPQQDLERSKVNELWALYYAKKGDTNAYNKYLKLAQENIYSGAKNINYGDNNETRGVWFDRGTIVKIKSRAEMSRYFDKLKDSGINTVYFETLNAGYTIYPSKTGVQNPLTKGRDPLAWAVEEAHARKIKLHAWLWIFAVGNDRHNKIIGKPTYYAGPVLEKNLKWALLGENGNFRPKNQPEFWIDPSNKEAVNYMLKISEEIMKNYNVDGLQLDYIRYPFQSADNLMGFNHNSTEQYTANTGEKLLSNNYQTNLMWNKWKEANINNFVNKIYHKAKRHNLNMKISASVFSKKPEQRLNMIQQNYENWIAGGYIDFITPMSYSSSIEGLNGNLSCLIPQNQGCLIYPGIALKHVDEAGLLNQISTIRERGFAGVSFFAVEQLDDDKTKFLKSADFLQASTDPTYQPVKSAVALMENYKTVLHIVKSNVYELSSMQKTEIDTMTAYAAAVILKANNNQLSSAVTTIKELERKNDIFFKNLFNYNKIRKQTMNSYLRRAENLLRIASNKKR